MGAGVQEHVLPGGEGENCREEPADARTSARRGLMSRQPLVHSAQS